MNGALYGIRSTQNTSIYIHFSVFLVVNVHVRTSVCSYMDAMLLSCCVELHSGILLGIHRTSSITSSFGHHEFSQEI